MPVGLEAHIYQHLVTHGVDDSLAQEAAERCANAILRDSIYGAAIGGVTGLLIGKHPVVAAIIGSAGVVIGGAAGGYHAYMSRSCEEYRNAAIDMAALH